MGSESRLWDVDGTNGKFRVLSTSGRPKEAAHRAASEEAPLEAAVPLWRGKQELGEAIRSLLSPDRAEELNGCTMLRIESRVAGIGLDEAIMWLRAQQGEEPPPVHTLPHTLEILPPRNRKSLSRAITLMCEGC
mmetsp:Transcript_41463/g.101181  ORF Transcript_41463/g.101181 Transcript_41463/m.101181 type:complete len:134 (-) Transcript_41463:1563-1964(-)